MCISVFIHEIVAFAPPNRDRAAFKKATTCVKEQTTSNPPVVVQKEEPGTSTPSTTTATTTTYATTATTSTISTTVSNYINNNHALAFGSGAATPAMVVYDYPSTFMPQEEMEEDEVIGFGTAIVACVVSLALGFSLGYGTM